jgi:hypothetical protein
MAILIVACSGGGGGGGIGEIDCLLCDATVKPAPAEAPSAQADPDQVVDGGTRVILDAATWDSDGWVSESTWTQIGGEEVELGNYWGSSAAFIAPEVTETAVLTFQLTVVDNEGLSASDTTRVTVEPRVVRAAELFPSDGTEPAFVVMRYRNLESVYHPSTQYVILNDLAQSVDAAAYDFVLLYHTEGYYPGISGSHTPGGRCEYPAENIGFPNDQVGQRLADCENIPAADWPQLKSYPEMGVVDRNDNDPLWDAMHQLGHHWQGWHGPVTSSWSHWRPTWVDEGLPGVMGEYPDGSIFNAFDLYAMGLLPYLEAREYSYLLHEREDESQLFTLTLQDLLDELAGLGPDYLSGDGTRVPEPDDRAAAIRVLLVLVAEDGQVLEDWLTSELSYVAEELPDAWNQATWGYSRLEVAVTLR